MEERFQRTARVLQGWTMHHPRQPPIPEDAKMSGLGRGVRTVPVGLLMIGLMKERVNLLEEFAGCLLKKLL